MSDEVKGVYVDGNFSDGSTRSVRGKIVKETDCSVTIQRDDGELTIGKNFIVKIEEWRGSNNEQFKTC